MANQQTSATSTPNDTSDIVKEQTRLLKLWNNLEKMKEADPNNPVYAQAEMQLKGAMARTSQAAVQQAVASAPPPPPQPKPVAPAMTKTGAPMAPQAPQAPKTRQIGPQLTAQNTGLAAQMSSIVNKALEEQQKAKIAQIFPAIQASKQSQAFPPGGWQSQLFGNPLNSGTNANPMPEWFQNLNSEQQRSLLGMASQIPGANQKTPWADMAATYQGPGRPLTNAPGVTYDPQTGLFSRMDNKVWNDKTGGMVTPTPPNQTF